MRLLLVMLKEPIAGQVKTRLGSSVGDELAATYYRALVEVLLKQLQGLQNCRIRFCFTPDDADDAVRFWLLPEMKASASPENDNLYLAPSPSINEEFSQEVDFRPQGSGNLGNPDDFGNRIEKAFQQGFDDGFSEIALINSDCPECGARWINAAFSRLEQSDKNLIIGPSLQGSYYLLALSAAQPALFQNINWDSDQVFKTTLQRAHELELNIEILPQLQPVINEDDWERIRTTPLNAKIKKRLGEDLDDFTV